MRGVVGVQGEVDRPGEPYAEHGRGQRGRTRCDQRDHVAVADPVVAQRAPDGAGRVPQLPVGPRTVPVLDGHRVRCRRDRPPHPGEHGGRGPVRRGLAGRVDHGVVAFAPGHGPAQGPPGVLGQGRQQHLVARQQRGDLVPGEHIVAVDDAQPQFLVRRHDEELQVELAVRDLDDHRARGPAADLEVGQAQAGYVVEDVPEEAVAPGAALPGHLVVEAVHRHVGVRDAVEEDPPGPQGQVPEAVAGVHREPQGHHVDVVADRAGRGAAPYVHHRAHGQVRPGPVLGEQQTVGGEQDDGLGGVQFGAQPVHRRPDPARHGDGQLATGQGGTGGLLPAVGQFESGGVEALELPVPVAEALGARLLLPQRRHRLQQSGVGRPVRGERGVHLDQLAEEDARGDGVEDQVVQDQADDVLAVAGQLPDAHQRAAVEGERRGHERGQRLLGVGRGRYGEHLRTGLIGVEDDLGQPRVAGVEHGAQRLVAPQEQRHGRPQEGPVQAAAHPEGEGQVVHGGAGDQAFQQPQRLLLPGDRFRPRRPSGAAGAGVRPCPHQVCPLNGADRPRSSPPRRSAADRRGPGRSGSRAPPSPGARPRAAGSARWWAWWS